MRHRLFTIIPVLWLWPAACLIPLVARSVLSPVSRDLSRLLADPVLVLGIIQAVLWAVIEAGLFLAMIIAITRSRHPRFVKGVMFVSTAVFATLYASVVSLMWMVSLRYQFMPQVQSAGLVGYLFERATLSSYLSFRDALTAVVMVLVISAVVLYETIKTARLAIVGRGVTSATVFCATAFIVNMLLWGGLRISMSHDRRSDYALYMANNTLPQGALLAWFAYRGELKTFSSEKLELNPVVPYKASLPASSLRNVLIVAIEAMRYDAFQQNSGVSAVLPNIQHIANTGVSMARAYAQAPDTEYSLNTILSGEYPLRFPFRRAGRRESYGKVELPQIFGSLGYRTAYLALFDWGGMQSKAAERRFDLYSDPTADGGGEEVEQRLLKERRMRKQVARVDRQETIARLDEENLRRFSEWLRADPRRPFFALFYLYNSHFPYNVPEDSYRETPVEEATYYFPADRREHYRQRYLGALRYMDKLVGELTKELSSLGVLNETVLVITGDHGEEFYEHGGCLHVGALHQEVLHVPLVYHGLPDGCVPSPGSLTGHIDIAPTVLDALGLPPYPGHQGKSLCREISDQRVLFSSSQGITDEDAVYWRDYKFVRNYRGLGSRLFNLRIDPQEMTNLLENAGETEIAEKLKTRLEIFRNRQLSFYAQSSGLQARFFPPAVEGLN